MIGIRYLGQDEAAASYIGGQLGVAFHPPFEVLGFMRSEWGLPEAVVLVGGAVLTGRTGANIDLTVYGPGCLTRDFLAAIAWHCYGRLRCERITVRCRRSNRPARKAAIQAGFTFEGTQRRYWGPTKADDAMVYGLLADECRWLVKGDSNGCAGPARPTGDRGSKRGNEQGNGHRPISAWRN